MDFDNELTALLAKQVEVQGQILERLSEGKQKSAYSTTTGNFTELHGVGSLFGSSPLERDIISAHIRPKGIANMLPAFPTVVEQPIYGLLTGVTDEVGAEAANPCSPAPNGFLKACETSAQFGRLTRDTKDIDITKVMLRKNRGDFTDLMLHGRMLGLTDLQPRNLNETQMLNVVTASEMVTTGVLIERKLAPMVWEGNTANNNAGGGYKEFPGLTRQINTGHVDWSTNTACPAVDSDVKDFAYAEVGGTTLDIVEYLSSMEFYLRHVAERSGLDPVQWVIAMRPELWFELSAVWPCSYLSHRCATSTGANPIVINDNVNVSMRDEMRNGKFIDINGNRYPVVTDDGIFEHNNINNANLGAAEYASTIYMVPLTIQGGFPVAYREYLDYRMAAADMALIQRGNPSFWTDDGMFLWVYDENRNCFRLGATTEQRVILRTPQLAGRLDSVKYSPLQHLRSPFADDPYFLDGGVSLRSDETGYAVWK